jgi:hypothetical protein
VSDNDGHSEKHWLPGQGVIDYPLLFQSLEAAQFDGLFVLEVKTWCEDPHVPSEIQWLHGFGRRLLDTGRPPSTPKTPCPTACVPPSGPFRSPEFGK